MTEKNAPWNKLVAAARNAPVDGDISAPYGFATRIAALAMADDRPRASLFARYSLRAVGFACLLAVVSVAANYSAIVSMFQSDPAAVTDDPVAEAVDLAS